MASKPRGFFKDLSAQKWSKDTSLGYYDSFQLKYVYPLIKLVMLVAFYSWIRSWSCWHFATICSVTLVFSYQRIVAMIVPNTIAIPSMD